MSDGLAANPPGANPPLRGAEEREFIQRCVHRQMVIYAGVFGVANLVALGALSYAVYQAANAAAKSVAQDFVEKQLGEQVKLAGKIIDEFVDLAKKRTDEATDRISQFDKEYPHLLATKERLDTDLKTLQASIRTAKILTI